MNAIVRRRRPLAAALAGAATAAAWLTMGFSPGAVAHRQAEAAVPQFGSGQPKLTVIATARDGLKTPRDLAFHPERPNELWTVNQANNGTVTFFNPGAASQRADARVDHYASHFMSGVSSIAFGAANTFATCQESRNGPTLGTGNDFMGPTLWLADMKIYARVNQTLLDAGAFGLPASSSSLWCQVNAERSAAARLAGIDAVMQGKLGSHIDMNHESPLCMGIAHDRANIYWVADGLAGNVVRYDFAKDHGPGNEDHSDAIIRRYPEARLTRVADVPSHLVLDPATGWLYYADTGAGVVKRLNTRSGVFDRRLRPQSGEDVAELSAYQDAAVEVFVEAGLDGPSGLAIFGGLLFVGDHGSGRIHAYRLADGQEAGRIGTGAQGLMGLTIGPDGKLWYVDGAANTLVRVDPTGSSVPTLTPEPTEAPSTPTARPTSEPSPTPAPSRTATSRPTDRPTLVASPTIAATRRPSVTPTPAARRAYLPRLLVVRSRP